MYGHTTHDQGIDADLGLFVHDGVQRGEFVHIPSHAFDPEANWNLLKSLLDTGNVQFVLLDQRHINAIRAFLVEQGMPEQRLNKMFVPRNTRLADDLRGVVRHAPNHSSHMHVRITPRPPTPRYD